MAATNFTPISLYYSTTSGASGIPSASNLVNGELAINITDGKLFYKDNSGVVQVLATKSGASGVFSSITNTGLTSGRVVYSTTGGLETDSANLLFNGTTLTANTLNLTNALGTTYGGTGLSSFTSGGVVYASSSSVLATGSALTFDGNANFSTGGANPATYNTLNINNTASSGYSRLFFNIGASGANGVGSIKYAPGIFFAIGTDSDSSSTPMTFNLNGSEQMRLTTTGLGIGTSSPAYALDVQKSIASGVIANFQNTNAGAVYTGIAFRSAAANANARNWSLTMNNNAFGDFAIRTSTANGGDPIAVGVDRLVIDSSGNLLVGVTGPTFSGATRKSIEVNGSTDSFITFGAAGSAIGYLYASASEARLWSFANVPLTLGTNNTERMRLDSSGNLGIGTSSPANPLNIVKDNTAARGQLSLQTSTAQNFAQLTFYDRTTLGMQIYQGYQATAGLGDVNIVNTGAAAIKFWTTNTDRMTLDSSGNLGLGVTPSAWFSTYKVLQIGAYTALAQSGSSNTFLLNNAYVNAAGTTTYLNTAAASYYNQSAGAHSWSTAPSGTAGNAITFTQAMTLDASGNLLVGNTTTILSSKVLSRFSGVTNNGFVADESANTSSCTFSVFSVQGTAIGSVARVGGTNAVVYNTTSDYRLKTVTGAVTGQGARIDALQPVEYTWNSNGSRTRGFLAHQFQEVYAGSVSGTKDAVDSEGKPVYQAMQASTAEVIADLVAEIQSLRIRIAQLEAQ